MPANSETHGALTTVAVFLLVPPVYQCLLLSLQSALYLASNQMCGIECYFKCAVTQV